MKKSMIPADIQYVNLIFLLQDGIPIDVIKPLEANRRPTVLVYFHDGAMVFGSRKTSSTICKILAR